MPTDQSPTGATRRRRRLSDQETERRMLDAALRVVNEVGLTVSLEHISLEDVIRDAGVSRSAVYRRWPYKDLFFSDLLRELANADLPSALPSRNDAMASLGRIALDQPDSLESPERRHALVVEMLRVGNLQDLETFARSTEWRTFIALHATYLSLEDGELRDDVQAGLARSERALLERPAGTLSHFAELLGYRLKPGLDITYETVIALGMPLVRGAVIMAPSTPEIVATRAQANPFGVEGKAEWSAVALAMTSIVLTFIEQDPDVVWDDERLARVRRELSGGTDSSQA